MLDRAKRFDLVQGRTVVLENKNELILAEDLAIYLARLGRSHSLDRYSRTAHFAPGSVEVIVLEAMRHARFSLWRVERVHESTGLILRDLPYDAETWLVGETMVKTVRPGLRWPGASSSPPNSR